MALIRCWSCGTSADISDYEVRIVDAADLRDAFGKEVAYLKCRVCRRRRVVQASLVRSRMTAA